MILCPLWVKQQPIAHRGLHGPGIPENSMAAFEAAIAQGYAIELDIHRLADGPLVVFHDVDLWRLTGVQGRITEQTTASLPSLALLGTQHPIPLLSEVLAQVDGRAPLLIEIKNDGSVGALETELQRLLARYRGQYAIQSFNPEVLGWFVRHAPGIPRGQLSSDFAGSDLAWPRKFLWRHLLLTGTSRPQFIAYDIRALPHWPVAIAAKLGLPVVAWTVRTEVDWQKAQQQGSNIIFEHIRP